MTGGRIEDFLLIARTTRHLRPSQLAHRARLRAQKAALARFPNAFEGRLRRRLPPRPSWPGDFLPLDRQVASGFPGAEANAEGRFAFLDEERRLGRPADWVQEGAGQLWRYHLHYFEWAWSFADHSDQPWASAEFRRLWRSWRDGTVFGRWDAWSPYVVSLRAWALCGLFGLLVAGTEDEAEFLADIALHAGFVRANLELDVGGNHLLKNLRALVGVGVFLEDEALIRDGTDHIGRQLAVQLLADGGHYERSPSYHCQVLGDLIDVCALLSAARRPPVTGLDEAIASMRKWLGAMRLPDGDVPLFNDCTLVGRHRLELLQPSAPPTERLTVLEPSGYVVVSLGGRMHLVADVGAPCPPELPAHAHADCLSFELAVDGRRLVVSAGTSTYEAGAQRAFERSTPAHSTLAVDGADQTEVWATFRAARRANATLERAVDGGSKIEVSASHDGYRRLPGSPRHRRTWQVERAGVQILDEVTGTGHHRIEAFLHLLGDASRDDGGGVSSGPTTIAMSGHPVTVQLRRTTLAEGFGRRRPGHVVIASTRDWLPVSLATHITIGEAAP